MTVNSLNPKLQDEIVICITNNFTVKDIILFGSYAWGLPNEWSDIDLVVVLEENGFSKNFEEKMQRKSRVSHTLLEIKKHISIDMLVYTKDEWNTLAHSDSSFFQGIDKAGKRLL